MWHGRDVLTVDNVLGVLISHGSDLCMLDQEDAGWVENGCRQEGSQAQPHWVGRYFDRIFDRYTG